MGETRPRREDLARRSSNEGNQGRGRRWISSRALTCQSEEAVDADSGCP